MKSKRYTKAEDAILRADYHRVAAADIGRRIGRSEGSVRQRAKVLGLAWTVDPEVELTPAERAHKAAESAERKRREHAERIAGCPLERWLASRENIMTGRNFGGATGHCKCCRRRQKFREAA